MTITAIPPPIQFTCRCGAANEGAVGDFVEQHTMPPSFLATCAFCGGENRVFPRALVLRAAEEAARRMSCGHLFSEHHPSEIGGCGGGLAGANGTESSMTRERRLAAVVATNPDRFALIGME